MDWLPLVATEFIQPPVAAQLLAPVELHVRTLLLPLAMVGGLAENVTMGGPGRPTKTWVLAALLVPPVPLQVNEYVVAAVSDPVDWVPLVATAPVHPPDAVHPVASEEFHVKVDAPPYATLLGAALSVAVGVGANVTVAETGALVPPGPLQVSVYTVVAVTIAGACEPLLASVPLQPPLAWQAVALLELQVSMVVPPAAKVAGLADSVAVGTKLTVSDTVELEPLAPLQTIENVVVALIAAVA